MNLSPKLRSEFNSTAPASKTFCLYPQGLEDRTNAPSREWLLLSGEGSPLIDMVPQGPDAELAPHRPVATIAEKRLYNGPGGFLGALQLCVFILLLQGPNELRL